MYWKRSNKQNGNWYKKGGHHAATQSNHARAGVSDRGVLGAFDQGSVPEPQVASAEAETGYIQSQAEERTTEQNKSAGQASVHREARRKTSQGHNLDQPPVRQGVGNGRTTYASRKTIETLRNGTISIS